MPCHDSGFKLFANPLFQSNTSFTARPPEEDFRDAEPHQCIACDDGSVSLDIRDGDNAACDLAEWPVRGHSPSDLFLLAGGYVVNSMSVKTSSKSVSLEIDAPPEDEIARLIQAAIAARNHAYAPHSHFYVGAALLMHDGKIIEGCNVENASYSLTQCAERVAVTSSVAVGYRDFRAVAIASIGGAMPCGACRQVLAEFGLDIFVYTVDVIDGDRQVRRLSELLPDAFSNTDIPSS